MTEEDTSPLLVRYRSTVTEEQTSALDEVILAAAARHAWRARSMRRGVVALALAALVILPFWRAHVVRSPQARDTSGYGREEGATRYYLLNSAGVKYTGPGSTEGKR